MLNPNIPMSALGELRNIGKQDILANAMNPYQAANQQLGQGKLGQAIQAQTSDPMLSALSGYNPEGALGIMQAKAKSDAMAKAKIDAENRKNTQDPTATSNVKQVAIQYRADLARRFSPKFEEMDDRARADLDRTLEGQRSILSQSVLGRSILGQINEEVQGPVVEEKTGPAPELLTDLKGEISEGAVDANNDGIIDNITSLKDKIRQFGKEYGVADPAYKDAESFLDDLVANVKDKQRAKLESEDTRYRRSQDERKTKVSETKDKIQQDKEYIKVWNSKENLLESPTPTQKRSSLNVMLRKETGAAIGADEFNDMMSFVLPEDRYTDFKSETQGIGPVLLGLVDDNARVAYMKRVAENYLGDVSPEKLHDYMDSSISSEYYKRKESPKKEAKSTRRQATLEDF